MKPSILTAGPRYFDFTAPSGPYSLFEIAHSLSNICRFTGHCRTHYSVAEHCVRASWIAPSGYALEALLHDSEEFAVGDMSTPLKAHVGGNYRAIAHGVDASVREWFGLPAKQDPVVKLADLVMLATERRDLMPRLALDEHWAILDGIEPLPDRIQPWGPMVAREAFIARFEYLIGRTAVVAGSKRTVHLNTSQP